MSHDENRLYDINLTDRAQFLISHKYIAFKKASPLRTNPKVYSFNKRKHVYTP